MLVVKNRQFARYAKQEKISDETLLKAINDIGKGLMDVDLGGGLIKQRLPRRGGGKSGGYRSIIALKREEKAFFLYGFAKNERDNIAKNDLDDLKKLAKMYFNLSREEFTKLLEIEEFIEVKNDK